MRLSAASSASRFASQSPSGRGSEAHALSRVSSYDALGSFVFIPLGQIAAGPTADLLGQDQALYLAAGIVATGIAAMLATPSVRELQAGVPAPTAASR